MITTEPIPIRKQNHHVLFLVVLMVFLLTECQTRPEHLIRRSPGTNKLWNLRKHEHSIIAVMPT